VAERDRLYGASTEKKAAGTDIPDFKVDSGADGWQKSAPVQRDLKTVSA